LLRDRIEHDLCKVKAITNQLATPASCRRTTCLSLLLISNCGRSPVRAVCRSSTARRTCVRPAT
jgi:hypothetical protein